MKCTIYFDAPMVAVIDIPEGVNIDKDLLWNHVNDWEVDDSYEELNILDVIEVTE